MDLAQTRVLVINNEDDNNSVTRKIPSD